MHESECSAAFSAPLVLLHLIGTVTLHINHMVSQPRGKLSHASCSLACILLLDVYRYTMLHVEAVALTTWGQHLCCPLPHAYTVTLNTPYTVCESNPSDCLGVSLPSCTVP